MTFTKETWVWTGFTGGPGYLTFRFDGALTGSSASTAAANTKTLLNNLAGYIPQGSTMTCQSTATVHDTDGTLTDTVAITTVPAPVAGSSAKAYQGGAGFVFTWNTGVIWLGSAVVGRTFICPSTTEPFDVDGTLTSTALTALNTWANTFATSTPRPIVWSRRPSKNPTAWSQSTMTAGLVKDRAAFLRSRRQ